MHIVFLVHGTWGKSDDAWYDVSNGPMSFAARLKTELVNRGFVLDKLMLLPFEWTGGNTHSDRLNGATSLASRIVDLLSQYPDATLHFVAHSHGGNVVLKALEEYLNNLPRPNVPHFFDPGDVVDVARTFLQDYDDGKYRFGDINVEVERLLRRLGDELQTIERRDGGSQARGFTDGTIYDAERSALRLLLGRLFCHVYSLPEFHRIGSVITLGTPFYEKRWTLTKPVKTLNGLLHLISCVPVGITITYELILLGGALAAITPWISWIGFNPIGWHWGLSVFAGLSTLYLTNHFARLEDPELPTDTNLYFDEAVIPYFVQILQANKLCRVLNVHASHLDEAYCLLSAYLRLNKKISKYYGRVAFPRFWDYKNPKGDVGFWRQSPPAKMQRNMVRLARLTSAITKLIAYPLRIIVHKLSTLYIARLVGTELRILGYGLPEDESFGTSEISVENVLNKSYFDTHILDVTRELASPRKRDVDVENRFEFLWDNDNLAKRIKDSILVKALGNSVDLDHQRQIVALEERVGEYFGVVGLRHSMYYDNDAVISGIADFLAKRAPA